MVISLSSQCQSENEYNMCPCGFALKMKGHIKQIFSQNKYVSQMIYFLRLISNSAYERVVSCTLLQLYVSILHFTEIGSYPQKIYKNISVKSFLSCVYFLPMYKEMLTNSDSSNLW